MQKKLPAPSANIFSLLKPYSLMISGIILLTLLSGGLNLVVPKIIATAIDSYGIGNFDLIWTVTAFAGVTLFLFFLVYAQNIAQIYASERVAQDLRAELIAKISEQDFSTVETLSSAKLLTNLTSDVDGVKTFISQAIASIVSSIFMILGSGVLLLLMNWKLALAVFLIMPCIGIAFALVFKRVRLLFKSSQENIDRLNNAINESILGAALIRLLNSQTYEYRKFIELNTQAKEIGLSILSLFATLIPIVTFTSNIATLVILMLGGHFVITGSMTLGDFVAFNSYLAILIFPIIILGFTSNSIAQATASYGRIREVLTLEKKHKKRNILPDLHGSIEIQDVSLTLGEKQILKNITFSIASGSSTAIMGPTAAGKTQLLYLLSWLLEPSSGTISYDGIDLTVIDREWFYPQIGINFQESSIFNLSLRENIAFRNDIDDSAIEKAIDTAELRDFIEGLPEHLDTVVSERGSSLSWWQKQRIMLARALAVDPKILFLDDFTARLDGETQKKILENLRKNYPNITLISITEKIAPIEHYEQIILLMEGEMLAQGIHRELMTSSPEYVQIYSSQQSINA